MVVRRGIEWMLVSPVMNDGYGLWVWMEWIGSCS